MLRVLVVGVFVVLGVVVNAQEVSAHAALLASTPSYAATVPEAPAVATFTFDNAVEPGLMRVKLTDLNDVEVGESEYLGESMLPTTQLKFSLPEHLDGEYLVAWTSFALDGHIVSGTIPYTVGGAAAVASAPDVPPTEAAQQAGVTTGQNSGVPGEIVEIQIRFISYLALSVLIGALVIVVLARTVAQTEAVQLIASQAQTAIVPAAVVASVAALARFALIVWRLDKVDATDQIVPLVVNGQLAVWLFAGLGAAGAGLLARKRSLAALALAGVAAAAVPAGGHAAVYPAPGIGTLFASAHLVAACVWAGSVGVFAYATTSEVWPTLSQRWAEVRELLKRLSGWFAVSFVVLGVTGARAAYVYTDASPQGRYGSVLWLKVAAVGVVAAIGGLNAFLRRSGRPLKVALLLGEAFVFIAVMILAAVLATTSPNIF